MIKKAKNHLQKENCQKIGSIIKTFGHKGQVVAKLSFNLEYIETESIFIEIDNCLIPFFIDFKNTRFKKNSATIKFKEINSIDETPTIINCDLYIPTEILDDNPEVKSEFEKLAGYEIIDTEKGKIGICTEIIEISKNPLINIKTPKSELLLPINGIEIINIDEQNQTITIKIPSIYIDL